VRGCERLGVGIWQAGGWDGGRVGGVGADCAGRMASNFNFKITWLLDLIDIVIFRQCNKPVSYCRRKVISKHHMFTTDNTFLHAAIREDVQLYTSLYPMHRRWAKH